MSQVNDVKSLDELIATLGGADASTLSEGPCELLLEHLQAARRGLLGSMAGEYRASLNFAKECLSCITDKGVRTEAKKILQGLLSANSATGMNPAILARTPRAI